MSTDTNVKKLVINKMTKEQYEGITPSSEELYILPDTPASTTNLGPVKVDGTTINANADGTISANVNNGTLDIQKNGVSVGTISMNSANNVTANIETVENAFVGTDGTEAGQKGLVPAPTTADNGKFLKADGTWGTAGPTVVQTAGTSTTDVMSQKAIRDYIHGGLLYSGHSGIYMSIDNYIIGGMHTGDSYGTIVIGAPSNGSISYGSIKNAVLIGDGARGGNNYSSMISIGASASATRKAAVSIGASSSASATNSVAIGSSSKATSQGELSIGDSTRTDLYNSTGYRKITNVYDGENAHDAATVAQGNTLSTTAPTTSTVGVLGQLYTDTTSMHTYQLGSIDDTDPSNLVYNWIQRW